MPVINDQPILSASKNIPAIKSNLLSFDTDPAELPVEIYTLPIPPFGLDKDTQSVHFNHIYPIAHQFNLRLHQTPIANDMPTLAACLAS